MPTDSSRLWIGRRTSLLPPVARISVPLRLKNQLKFSPYVTDAVVIGDRRKYLTCLVMIDNETVSQFAQENNVPFSDFKSLCATAEVQSLIKSEIERINLSLAQVENAQEI